MSGDMDLATTTAAGAAQNAAAQAQSLAAAAAAPAAAAQSGAYGWGAMNIASQSLPAVPARSSSAGRPARPVAAIFQPGHLCAAGRSASAPRPKKRGRPPKAGGGFICPRCNVGVGRSSPPASRSSTAKGGRQIQVLRQGQVAPQRGLDALPAGCESQRSSGDGRCLLPCACLRVGADPSLPRYRRGPAREWPGAMPVWRVRS